MVTLSVVNELRGEGGVIPDDGGLCVLCVIYLFRR